MIFPLSVSVRRKNDYIKKGSDLNRQKVWGLRPAQPVFSTFSRRKNVVFKGSPEVKNE